MWRVIIATYLFDIFRLVSEQVLLRLNDWQRRIIENVITSTIFSIQKLPAPLRKKYQMIFLKRALESAAMFTPYWKVRVPSRCRKRLDASRISELPLLTRGHFLEDMAQITSSKPIRRYAIKTTGTTGTPMRFFIDADLFFRRAFEISYILKILKHENSRVMRLSYNDMTWSEFQGVYIDPICIEPVAFRTLYIQKKPNALYGTVSHVLLLAEFYKREKISYPFDVVLTRSEHLTEENRTYLEKVFRAKVYNIYASREFGPIGQECTEQNGFHINEDWILLEILDKDGRKTDETGDIAITSLFNRSLPFIRYLIGDRGRFIKDPCSCGLQTPRINFEGRTTDFIFLPDRRRIPVIDLYRLVTKQGVRHFQFEQPSLTTLNVRLVTTGAMPSLSFEITDRIREFLHIPLNLFSINVENVSTISLTKTGKWPVFISSIHKSNRY